LQPFDPVELHIDEADVERSVMDDQRGITDERQKSSTSSANNGFEERNSLESPCTANASAGMSRSGLK